MCRRQVIRTAIGFMYLKFLGAGNSLKRTKTFQRDLNKLKRQFYIKIDTT